MKWDLWQVFCYCRIFYCHETRFLSSETVSIYRRTVSAQGNEGSRRVASTASIMTTVCVMYLESLPVGSRHYQYASHPRRFLSSLFAFLASLTVNRMQFLAVTDGSHQFYLAIHSHRLANNMCAWALGGIATVRCKI